MKVLFSMIEKNVYILFSFSLVFLLSCNYSVETIRNLPIIYGEDGIIYNAETEEPYSGKVIDTLVNRIVKFDVKDGLKNGEFLICFLDGTNEILGKIVNNKNEGKWNYYYENGKLESEGYFKNDQPDSKWIWYYQDGEKMEEGNFVDGKREGLWILYNEDGSVKDEIIFNNGNVVISHSDKSKIIS